MTYLFIVMDDERRAHPEYLESAQAVCDAVKRSVFDYRDGAEWLPEHIEEAAGLTATLLEDGKLSFEGDAPIYLFQLADGVMEDAAPKLTVWFGAMPESNGKANWTAILYRGDISASFTIERSEHHDRVRYEADRVRFLIGELAEEPDILAYDANMLSPAGWVHPCGVQACRYTNEPGGACWRQGKSVEICTCHTMTDKDFAESVKRHADCRAPGADGVTACRCEREGLDTRLCSAGCHIPHIDGKLPAGVNGPLKGGN